MTSDPTSGGAERRLVERAQAGDAHAISQLFTQFWRAARASAYAVLRDMSSAEDAASEAFRLALPRLGQLRDPGRFGPWLRRIVRRVAAQEATRTRRAAREVVSSPDGGTADPGRVLERRQMALLLSRAVDRLPQAQREAILLFYFEGYPGDEAARFLGIPVGSLRRRLHDGRLRLRKDLTGLLEGQTADASATARLHARVHEMLASEGEQSQWYDVLRDVLLTRPVPCHLLAALVRDLPAPAGAPDAVRHLLRRPRGPLLEDAGPVGDAARALRAALHEFEDWAPEQGAALERFPDVFRRDASGRAVALDSAFALPGLSSGEPGRYIRVTRGLLFGSEETGTIDSAELLLRSESFDAFRRGMTLPTLSDVLDAYCVEARALELAEIEAWLADLSARVAPSAHARFSAQPALRYRTALRLTFDGDPRPAAIGGILAGWGAQPEGLHVAHVRLYVEPWAQARSGRPVKADAFRPRDFAPPNSRT